MSSWKRRTSFGESYKIQRKNVAKKELRVHKMLMIPRNDTICNLQRILANTKQYDLHKCKTGMTLCSCWWSHLNHSLQIFCRFLDLLFYFLWVWSLNVNNKVMASRNRCSIDTPWTTAHVNWLILSNIRWYKINNGFQLAISEKASMKVSC